MTSRIIFHDIRGCCSSKEKRTAKQDWEINKTLINPKTCKKGGDPDLNSEGIQVVVKVKIHSRFRPKSERYYQSLQTFVVFYLQTHFQFFDSVSTL